MSYFAISDLCLRLQQFQLPDQGRQDGVFGLNMRQSGRGFQHITPAAHRAGARTAFKTLSLMSLNRRGSSKANPGG